ncbi:hypothetical protein PG991_015244 [Apiospora marii]|uniref:Uncharacterized protein n=1 Tax=Apiospora marii TaxID=335849 RepID=A0ABR1R2X5_9PEZI
MTGLTIFLAVLAAFSAAVPIAAPEVEPHNTACTTCRRNVEAEELTDTRLKKNTHALPTTLHHIRYT